MFGDFWLNSGEKLAEAYISGKRKMPQAVLCANDYMAYGLLDTLADHGIPVPETLTVAGYEFVCERHMHTPILTTFQRNRVRLGRIAVEMLLRKADTGKFGSFAPPRGRVICGNSCSCGIALADMNTELKAGRTKTFYEFLHLYNQLEQRLTEAQSMREFCVKFVGSEYLLRNVKALDLCLYQHWYQGATQGEMLTHYPVYDEHFGKVSVIPRMSLSALTGRCPQPAAYYCSPLFFSDRPPGFVMIRYDTPETYDPVFRNWMKAVSNALEFLRMKNDIQYLMECQNLSEYQDTLAGLLNRKGFSHELHLQIRQQDAENPQVYCFLLQTGLFTDHLVLDNKTEEIAAHKAIAEMLRKYTQQPMLCARIEPNLYAFAGIGDSAEILPLLQERMTAMLLNQPDCFALFGLDSCCTASVQMPYESSTALLTTSGLDLSVIVTRCGYDDYGYCLRLFRQFTGYTPNQYRKL